MLVVNIVGLMPDGSYDAIRIDDVPNDFRMCSQTGEYLPQTEFGLKILDDGTTRISRTNCERTYNMSKDDYNAIYESLKQVLKSKEYLAQKQRLTNRQNMLYNTMKIRDMIEALQKLDPDDLVCVTQSGYYAEGYHAYIFEPTLEGKVDVNLDGGIVRNVYSIGHSTQTY